MVVDIALLALTVDSVSWLMMVLFLVTIFHRLYLGS